jgi:uncharacterized membrane protein
MASYERDTERLEYFSDAVIAIAATLLSADLYRPTARSLGDESLLRVLIDQWPSFFAFVVSFLFIGIAWAAHHDMFHYIRRTDHVLLVLNLFFLMGIAVQPFSTALLAEHLGHREEQTAALVYYGVLLLTSLGYNVVWLYAVRWGLVYKQTDARLLRTLSIEHGVPLLLHAAALLIACWSVPFSFVPVLVAYAFFAIPRLSERWALRPCREVEGSDE